MMPSKARRVSASFAIMLLAGAALAACANGNNGPAQSLSDLSDKGGSMVKLGEASRAAGDCAAAIRFYRQVRDSDEHRADAVAAHLGAADCELAANSLAAAAADYRTAIGLAPNEPGPLIGMGRLYLVQHRPGDAATYFDQAIKKGADAAFVWNDKGVAYDQLRRHAEAQQAYRTGLTKYPGDRALRNNLALSLAMSGKFKEAESLLQALVAEPGATPRMRENLALALGLDGDVEAARRVSQDDLDGGALDNNTRFYEYARAMITGAPLPAMVSSTVEERVPVHAVAQHVPVPPPVLTQTRPLPALRAAPVATLDRSQAAAQVTKPAAPTAAVQTAELPPPEATARPAPAAPAAVPKPVASTAGAPTRLGPEPASAKTAAPKPAAVASSEEQ